MSVAREEVFGPVFTMLTYDDMDDAVAIPLLVLSWIRCWGSGCSATVGGGVRCQLRRNSSACATNRAWCWKMPPWPESG